MKKLQKANRTMFHLCYALLAVSLVGLVSCKKPPIEDEDKGPTKYDVHTEETEGQVVVSEKYVPVDWEKGTNEVLKADAEKGEFTMNLTKDDSKDIKKGSIMTIDVDSTIYLVKVKDYKINGENVELETEQASFAEVFAGSSFELTLGDFDIDAIDKATDAYVEPDLAEYYEDDYELSTRSDISLQTEGESEGVIRHSTMKIYPSEIRFRGDDGNMVQLPYESLTRAMLPPMNLHWEKDFPLSKDGNPKQGFSFASGFKIDANITISFGMQMFTDIPAEVADDINREDIGSDDDELESSSTFQPKFMVDPSFDASVTFYSTIKYAFKPYDIPLDDVTIASFKFFVGIVPVWIDLVLSTYIRLEAEVSGGLNVSWGFRGSSNAPFYVGLDFNGKEGVHMIKGGGPFKVVTSWPTAELGVGAQMKVRPSLGLSMLLYSLAGPKADIGPVFLNHVNAGVGVVADIQDGPEGMIFWDAGIDLGAEYQVGIRLGTGKIKKFLKGIIDHDIEFDPQPLPLFKGLDKLAKKTKSKSSGELQIMTAPVAISCTNEKSIQYGKDNKVDFQIQWQLFGENKNMGIPVFVYFQTDDAETNELYRLDRDDYDFTMEKGLAICSDSDGKVSVGWMPQSPSSSLEAIVYDGSGKIRCTYTVKSDNAPDGIKAVDLGCSVLWANMNVGAKTEGETGDLVGWGDKTGKNIQQWINKECGSYVEDIPTSMGMYGGAEFDRSGIAHTKRDYATAKWGGQWRMPTRAQWEELIKKCKWEWDEERYAFKVSGNGNYIYLPAAGYRIGNRLFNKGQSTEMADEHPSCEYWSASCDLKTKEDLVASYPWMDKDRTYVNPNAFYMYYDPKGKQKKAATGSTAKCYGQSVRPVFPNPNYSGK